MIKLGDFMDIRSIEKMRGGDGVIIQKLLLDDKDKNKHIKLYALMTIKENCSIGEHQHIKETEYYYILSGKGEVLEKDGVRAVKPGDLVITGDQESHAIRNTGKEDLVFTALIVLD